MSNFLVPLGLFVFPNDPSLSRPLTARFLVPTLLKESMFVFACFLVMKFFCLGIVFCLSSSPCGGNCNPGLCEFYAFSLFLFLCPPVREVTSLNSSIFHLQRWLVVDLPLLSVTLSLFLSVGAFFLRAFLTALDDISSLSPL